MPETTAIRTALPLVAALLLASTRSPPAAAQEGGAGEVSLEEPGPVEAGAPWRGSEVVWRNAVAAVGLDPSAEMTWNPWYAMTWTFRPRWWFDDVWSVGARLDVAREITESDETTFAGEALVGDLLLTAGASRFWTIPVVGIDLSADLILATPTSKASRYRTLALALGPGLQVGRTFDLLGDFHVGYHVRFTSFLHRYTTSERETPVIPSCGVSGSGCESFVNTGERNVRWRVQHGIDLSWTPLDWLGASTGFEHLVSWLYPLEADDSRISDEIDSPEDRRHASAFYVEATFVPLAALEIGLGFETVSPQLAPDSTYYDPFWNRYSTLYLDLRLEIEGLVASIRGEEVDE